MAANLYLIADSSRDVADPHSTLLSDPNASSVEVSDADIHPCTNSRTLTIVSSDKILHKLKRRGYLEVLSHLQNTKVVEMVFDPANPR